MPHVSIGTWLFVNVDKEGHMYWLNKATKERVWTHSNLTDTIPLKIIEGCPAIKCGFIVEETHQARYPVFPASS